MFYFNIRNILVECNFMGLAFFGSLLGIVSGIALIGVGLTPSDLYLPLHDVAARWLFRCFFLTSICYSLIIYRSNLIENTYVIGYLIFALSILIYIFISELGPKPSESEFALTFQVVSQKIIMLILVSVVFIQTRVLQRLL